MRYEINDINNVLEVHKRLDNRLFYLSRNVLCRIEPLKFCDVFKIKKKLLDCRAGFYEDKNMLFHYKFIYDSRIYLMIYCIKQRLEDKDMAIEGDVFPVQFLINDIYGKRSKKNDVLCIVYKIRTSVYIVYSRKKTIIYSRVIDEKSVTLVNDIIKQDADMISNKFNKNFSFSIVSNVENLKKSDYILRYLKEDADVLSV